MNFEEYQSLAKNTDQRKDKNELNQLIPVLGLVGEIGSVISEYKKRIRDGQSYENYKTKLQEEIGDVLWYLANICNDMDLTLESAARRNIEITEERWKNLKNFKRTSLYDELYNEKEQLPRHMIIQFKTREDGRVSMTYNGKELGDPLDDNAYSDDGYRFHDAIHLAFASILGWSPVIRALLGKKRKSNQTVDDVEDGARAIIIEEAISILIYNYASNHNYFEGISTIDYDTLKGIKSIVSHLEVSDASTSLWEKAILEGYRVFRELRNKNEGIVICDLKKQTIQFVNG